ncbi:radical SAM protein [bacterium]|nr:radical SAM protein [bacterium]
MIGLTKLLCGTATVSDAIKFGRDSSQLPPNMLQFSSGEHPLVVWNMTNRCNLHCKHCYINANDYEYKDELSTEEATRLIDDLVTIQSPVLLFSGGEPLLREDILELGTYASYKGLRPVISSNGTLITLEIAQKIKDAGFQYVGISLDGSRKTHDEFRGIQGAFDSAICGIKNCLEAGLRTGIRFTITKYNYLDLPLIIELLIKEKIPRFCMYHLVYAGRGRGLAKDDITLEQKRNVINFLINKTQELFNQGIEVEILTTDNHADGVYLYQLIKAKYPSRTEEVMQLLKMHGGCSAGKKFANIDSQGNVHACQFWGHKDLGNIRERKFSEIWRDRSNELICELRNIKSKIKGRCSKCNYLEVCGGCRIRAEVAYGDIWAEDPACYLTDEEISDK